LSQRTGGREAKFLNPAHEIGTYKKESFKPGKKQEALLKKKIFSLGRPVERKCGNARRILGEKFHRYARKKGREMEPRERDGTSYGNPNI